MRKILPLLLALLMIASLTTVAFAADTDEFVTLNWYTKGDKPADYDLVMTQLNAYLKEKINANVNINFVQWGTEWDTFVATQVATNEGNVDIMFTAGWDRLVNHIAAGYLVPLNGDPDYGNLLEEYGQGIIENIDPSYITGNEIDGVLYGISCNKELAANYGFLFNPDLVEKYGFDVSSVKTIRDIEPFLEAIKDEPGLIAAYGLNNAGLAFFAPLVEIAGDGNLAVQYNDDRDSNIFFMYDCPEWIELLNITKDWYDAGYISTDVLQKGPSYEADYQSGFYGVIAQSMKPGKGAEFSVGGKASLEAVITDTVIRTKDVSGSMLAIVEGTLHPERAMKFLNLLESDPYVINTILFGLEGVHFDFADKDAGIIAITEQGKNQYPMKGNAWMMGNQFINYLTTEESPDKWDLFKQFNAAGRPVQSLGFNFDVQPISPTLTALISIRAEYDSLMFGQLNVEEKYAEFLAAMKQGGIDDLLAEVTKQYEAWKAQ